MSCQGVPLLFLPLQSHIMKITDQLHIPGHNASGMKHAESGATTP